MSETKKVRWIGPARFLPPHGMVKAGDPLVVTQGRRDALVLQRLAEDWVDEPPAEAPAPKSRRRQEVG